MFRQFIITAALWFTAIVIMLVGMTILDIPKTIGALRGIGGLLVLWVSLQLIIIAVDSFNNVIDSLVKRISK